jgi:hypothetical protein
MGKGRGGKGCREIEAVRKGGGEERKGKRKREGVKVKIFTFYTSSQV